MGAQDYKVLIVDDHMVMRTMVKNFCAAMGFQHMEFANDGAEALKILKSQNIDLVLMDWNMPGMSGLEVVKTARLDKAYDSVAFVMVTAEAERDYVIKALEAGVVSYITKPFSQADFEKKMKGVLAWLRGHKKDRPWRNV